MADVASGSGEGRAIHVVARHDWRGHVENRRDVSDREAGGSVRRLAASVRPAYLVGFERSETGGAEGEPAERRPSGDLPSSREGHRLDREDQPIRRRLRSYGIQKCWHSVL